MGTKDTKRKGDAQTDALKEWVKVEMENYIKSSQKGYYGHIISKVEKELIHQVLEMTNGKKVETAEILGITRNTLRTKMSNYGLE